MTAADTDLNSLHAIGYEGPRRADPIISIASGSLTVIVEINVSCRLMEVWFKPRVM